MNGGKMILKLLRRLLLVTALIAGCTNKGSEIVRYEEKISPPIFETDRFKTIVQNLRNGRPKGVLVAVYTRYGGKPENSLQAIRHYIEIGIDIIELDIQKTSDGHLVLMSDETLDRTTTGSGLVSDWTLDSLKTLRLRNARGELTDQSIPTLEEAMRIAHEKVVLCFNRRLHLLPDIVELQNKGRNEDIIIFKERYSRSMEIELEPLTNHMILVPVVDLDDPHIVSIISDLKSKSKTLAFELFLKGDTSGGLERLNQIKTLKTNASLKGYWINLYTDELDSVAGGTLKENYSRLINTGASVIQTDRPEVLIEYLKSQGHHP